MTAHLWQSTVFAGIATLLAFAFRKQRAGIRYWIWLAASIPWMPWCLAHVADARIRRQREWANLQID